MKFIRRPSNICQHRCAGTTTTWPSCRRRWRSSRRRHRRSAASIAYTIMALFSLAIAWACLGKVDIVASAQGKIIPSGRTKVIQPFETGVVRAIHVHDGQIVKAGEVLIELDPTMNDADQQALCKATSSPPSSISPGCRRSWSRRRSARELSSRRRTRRPDLIAMQRKFLIDQVGEQRAKLAGPRPAARRKAGRVARPTSATVDKLEASLPGAAAAARYSSKRFTTTRPARKPIISSCCRPSSRQQHELDVQKSKHQRGAAALAAITRVTCADRGGIPAHPLRRARRGRTQGGRRSTKILSRRNAAPVCSC